VSTFTAVSVPLTAYAGQPSVRFRFRFTSNASTQNDGWYVDDILVGDATLCGGCDALGACTEVATDDSACGTIDCDGLDVACRDYGDLTADRCEGLNDCKDANTLDCTAFTDLPAGDPCGTGTGLQEGFESGTSAWVLQSPWGTTTSMAASGTTSLTDSPAGNYVNSISIAATLATPISLAGVTTPTLTFSHRYSTESCCDHGRVEISTNGGASWTQLAQYSGSLSTWTPVTISLTSYAGQPSVLIRFRFTTDGSIISDGWYLDDVAINASAAGSLCRACDGVGSCSMPMADDSRCGVIDCDGLDSVCADFTDITTNRCEADGCKDANTTDCATVAALPPGTDCGVCAACDASGICAPDLGQDIDCSSCRMCAGVNTCVLQPAGMDEKNECAAGVCATGACNGSGACGISPSGTDCGDCSACNAAGSCVADLTQDIDCPPCQECTGISSCAFQGAGLDVKNECPSGLCVTGACNGSGDCGELADGSSCDPDACSSGATCMEGACGPPSSMVTCPAPDPCWEPGVCDPSTGSCGASSGPRPDGSGCDDGRACTIGDRCLEGACIPLANKCPCGDDADCVPLDDCHLAGSCDTSSGVCNYPSAPDGTECNDGDACTSGEVCQDGECGSPASMVNCTALDTCHLPGTCDPATGTCSNPRKANGVSCDDGRACTTGDACEAGVCTPSASDCFCSSSADCFALGQCYVVGTCDLSTNRCSTPPRADGTGCDDADVCTTGESCQAGACGTPATVADCPSSDECHLEGACDPDTGVCSNPRAPDGTLCTGGVCQFGFCRPPAGDAGGDGPAVDGGEPGADEGGCGCRVPRGTTGSAGGWWLGLAIALGVIGARRRGGSRRVGGRGSRDGGKGGSVRPRRSGL
jgi:hypothetical protein